MEELASPAATVLVAAVLHTLKLFPTGVGRFRAAVPDPLLPQVLEIRHHIHLWTRNPARYPSRLAWLRAHKIKLLAVFVLGGVCWRDD